MTTAERRLRLVSAHLARRSPAADSWTTFPWARLPPAERFELRQLVGLGRPLPDGRTEYAALSDAQLDRAIALADKGRCAPR